MGGLDLNITPLRESGPEVVNPGGAEARPGIQQLAIRGAGEVRHGCFPVYPYQRSEVR